MFSCEYCKINATTAYGCFWKKYFLEIHRSQWSLHDKYGRSKAKDWRWLIVERPIFAALRYESTLQKIIKKIIQTTKRFQDSFNGEMNIELLKIDVNKAEFSDFNNDFISVLNNHISKRQKYARANNAKLMNKQKNEKNIEQTKKPLYQSLARIKKGLFSPPDHRMLSDKISF